MNTTIFIIVQTTQTIFHNFKFTVFTLNFLQKKKLINLRYDFDNDII